MPGVHAVFTHHDTRALDDVVRYIGQRVAAVVADTEAAAAEGCRRLVVEYEVLPHVLDLEEVMRPGINVAGEAHDEVGDVESGFGEAAVVYEETFRTQRVQHAGLETRSAVAYYDEDDRLVVRTSSQTPFLTRRALCDLHDLPHDRVRVLPDRAGGGFGSEHEMIFEDIVVLAAIHLKRPVKLEYTRAEQLSGAATRHPFTVRVKAGAKRDGSLTALQARIVADIGAYGNHGLGVMFDSVVNPSACTAARARSSTGTPSTRIRFPPPPSGVMGWTK
ncbi:xanthine dehydrogenase family protein molybdopterin-binding subunit [Nocardia sp. NPDC020380]|uniref:xanthine dehydrogenase family protein molybdopterin-binding subunit n=1 Tax=Nocardia sp. NPDC020380 TaxID=3364309 RepID=UPI0037A7D1DB